jgi:hypothetical protein
MKNALLALCLGVTLAASARAESTPGEWLILGPTPNGAIVPLKRESYPTLEWCEATRKFAMWAASASLDDMLAAHGPQYKRIPLANYVYALNNSACRRR